MMCIDAYSIDDIFEYVYENTIEIRNDRDKKKKIKAIIYIDK